MAFLWRSGGQWRIAPKRGIVPSRVTCENVSRSRKRSRGRKPSNLEEISRRQKPSDYFKNEQKPWRKPTVINLSEITPLAQELNQTTAQINSIISTVNEKLAPLNLGIEVWLEDTPIK